ncbi:MAG: bifunctional folylpolyglutamate synthase/dihydrofolate synthase [Verrucomicrobia bacterium]|nr:bifunctional folylpolyglutamate synthase/dihydrofolate synthase [Verrucomicrobiota bacterium]
MSDYAAAKEFLLTLKKRGVQLGLDRMRGWCAALGHPETAVPCIHLAGTNGKGSVAAMLAAVLREAGWRTGLYTSPHLVRLGERVQVDGAALTEAELAAAVAELRPVAATLVPDWRPTYFEFMTGLAFRHFAARRCDIVVIETGVGGRLDATNVVLPELSVITSIGLDHAEILGDTLEKIAAEKAGIIKPGRPVVLGRLPATAEAVICDVAKERDASVHSVVAEFGGETERYPQTNLAGDYQRWNAATATLAARLLPARWRLDAATVARGLGRVTWPGRWQRCDVGGRLVMLDASHNAEGAQVLDANLTQLRAETGRAPTIVSGVLGLTRARPLFEVIARHAGALHLVMPRQARASTVEQLRALVPAEFRGAIATATVESLFPAPAQCTAAGGAAPVVVTGSIYLAGEVLARLDPRHGPLESELQDF